MLCNLYKLALSKRNQKKINYPNYYNKDHKQNYWFIFFYGILGGLFIAILSLYFHYKHQGTVNNIKLTTKTKLTGKNKQITLNKVKNKNLLSTNNADNYDFYHLLTDNKQTLIPSSNKYTYIIELGNFNKLSTADELKAKLALQGFEARIQNKNCSINKKNIYKVIIGPFSSETSANIKKNQLTIAGFNSKLTKN